ncbi:TetR/AcrR family transcriptional regulator [Actinomadura meridiana]|uniref:TetR/AcrR family transcriptional regulator n=1 Tax=Actinomadura meridiana TaxID=559626 RepID=A0ABP8CEN1_9ACTN
MGRPAKFDRDQILDAALTVTSEAGPGAVTISAIANHLGAPSGSLYHRFASRDLLLATLWIRTVHRFQEGFATALDQNDPVTAALHTPRWCRHHLNEAKLLLLYRHQDLATTWPTVLAPDLETLNTRTTNALTSYTSRNPNTTHEHLIFATVDVPYGAVHRHLLKGNPPPPTVDDLITKTCQTVLKL